MLMWRTLAPANIVSCFASLVSRLEAAETARKAHTKNRPTDTAREAHKSATPQRGNNHAF